MYSSIASNSSTILSPTDHLVDLPVPSVRILHDRCVISWKSYWSNSSLTSISTRSSSSFVIYHITLVQESHDDGTPLPVWTAGCALLSEALVHNCYYQDSSIHLCSTCDHVLYIVWCVPGSQRAHSVCLSFIFYAAVEIVIPLSFSSGALSI